MMNFKSFSLVLVLISMISACSLTRKTIKSEIKPDIELLSDENKLAVLLDTTSFKFAFGKAKVSYSDQSNSERLTVEFETNATQTFMRFKNSLGIEGLHLFIDSDSLTEYNKIEKTVIKTSRNDFGMYFSHGYAPIPIMDLLFPARLMKGETQLIETPEFYKMENETQLLQAIVFKGDTEISEINNLADISSFQKIEFEDYSLLDGQQVPRRITIYGPESSKYKISILITELRVQKKSKTLKISIPSNLKVERM